MAEIHRQPVIATLGEAMSYLGLSEDADDKTVGQVQTIKRAAESAVRNFLNCSVTRATFTHFLPRGNPFDIRASGPLLSQDGRSTQRHYLGEILTLPQYPIRSITTVHEDAGARFGQVSGSFGSDALLTEGTDYTWPIETTGFGNLGVVYRINTQWLAEPGSIKVVYLAGWTKAELHGDTDEPVKDATPIRLGVLKTVAEFWADKKQAEAGVGGAPGAIKAESLADYSVTYDTSQAGAGVRLPEDVKAELRRFRRLESVRAAV
jgi:hypothetical protein